MSSVLQQGTTLARSSLPLSFTDGDSLKRFTIVDSFVTVYSHIIPSVRRADIADVDDPGWIYDVNVVSQSAGSFDVLIAVVAGDAPAGPGEFPNETVTLTYLLQ